MAKKRIVVTGMGVVSCFGNDVDTYYQSLLDGKSGVSLITAFPCEEFPTRIAASIKNFEPGDYIDKKQARRIDKNIAYTLVAGKKAAEASKLDADALALLDKTRCGILVGSGMGGMSIFYEGVQTLLQKGQRWVSPFFVPYILTNMGGAMLAMDLGFLGPNYSISTACATGNNAIIAAANHIMKNEADMMICGGSESPIIPISVAGFNACKALSQRNDQPEKASRPWDRSRDGFVMGEGAGIIVLESLEHALARGAPIIAEYLGGGVSCDAYHITEPRADGEGVALCVRNALAEAGVKPEDVNYINAHGTSTPIGDMAEVRAIKKVFMEPGKIAMNSTKSMIGHCLGAAGGMEAIATLKAIQTGMIHPSINLEDPEPDLGFHIPARAEKRAVNVAISNSFGFGGHNATIVLGAYHQRSH